MPSYSNRLALEVEGRIVNPRPLEPCGPGFGDGDGQVVRVMVVFLRVKEDLRAVRAVLRHPDGHSHRDLLVDPVGCFQGSEWHGGILSVLGQEDGQQDRGVVNGLDGVRLPAHPRLFEAPSCFGPNLQRSPKTGGGPRRKPQDYLISRYLPIYWSIGGP